MVTVCSIMLCVKDFAPEKWNQPHYYLCLKSPPNTFRPLVNGERDDAARLVGDLEEGGGQEDEEREEGGCEEGHLEEGHLEEEHDAQEGHDGDTLDDEEEHEEDRAATLTRPGA